MKPKHTLLALAAAVFLSALQPFSPSVLSSDAPPARPKITGISHAAVFYTNLEDSRAFYKNYLGFDEPYSAKNPDGSIRLTWIKVNDIQQIELFPIKNPGDPDHLYQVAFVTENAEALRRYLASKGVKVSEKPVGKGTIGNANFTFKDPDGHIIEIVEYCGDGWTMLDKGKHLPSTRIAPRIRHIGIKVADLEASMRLYRDILGFVETWRGSRDDKLLSWVNLRVPDGDEYLELMLYGGPEPKEKQLGTMNHICLEVENVPAAYETLQARTLPSCCAATSAPKTGVNGKRQINAFDPLGTRVEIMEPGTHDGKPVPSSTALPPIPDKLKKS